MSFRLTPLHSEESQEFTLLELLELLGDTVNDEILIKGKPYRLSSFEDLGGGGNSPISAVFQTYEFIVNAGDNNTYNLGDHPPLGIATFLTVNGIAYRFGNNKDYHISQNDLLWHGPVDLALGDILVLRALIPYP